MSKATEEQLAILHKKVAETMTDALDQADVAARLIIKYKDGELPDDVVRFLENAREVNPSLLTSATKFLKDNNISCDPEESSEVKDLEARLKAKRQSKGNVTSISFED